jgi:hypothetical protein
MKNSLYLSGLLLAALLALPGRAMAAKATQNIAYDSRSLATTLWYPDNLAVIRGVLVFTGGASGSGSGDTRDEVNNPFWQRFAEVYGFAVLGNQFSGSYADAAMGSGQALIDALNGFAQATHHAELARAPLLLEGFSNGGYFSFTLAQRVPARVIAFCLNKSGFAKAPLDAPFLAVPGLFLWGSEEPAHNVPTVIHALVEQGRTNHALWSEWKDWGAQHEEGNAEPGFAPFFAEMIAARYPRHESPADGDVALIALSESSGWLGDHADASINTNLPRIAAFAGYSGDKAAASWLPSEALANIWRGFVTKTPLTLTSPMPATQADANQPLQLTATGLGNAESASFLAGATLIARGVSASGGKATAAWTASSGGVSGLLALAMNGSEVTRTSRPVHVVLYGKPLTPDAMPSAAGSHAAGHAAGAAGARAADSGSGVAAVGGSGESRQPVRGGCAVCEVRPRSGVGASWLGFVAWLSARRRALVRSLPSAVLCAPR